MEGTTDEDYAYVKQICKDFETKHLGEYHDLYIQSNTLLIANTAQKMKFSIKDFFRKCHQIRSFRRI